VRCSVWECGAGSLLGDGKQENKSRYAGIQAQSKYQLNDKARLKPVVETEKWALTLASIGREDSREVGMLDGDSRELRGVSEV
jgi:hypothetical protein